MEECVFRAIPLSLGALIGARYGRRTLGIAIAFVVQALVFGGAHANYPGFPRIRGRSSSSLPSIVWALIFLRFGLLPTILLHATFDLALFSIPLFLLDAPGARLQQALVIAAAAVPLFVIAWRRAQAGGWHELPDSLRNARGGRVAPQSDGPRRVRWRRVACPPRFSARCRRSASRASLPGRCGHPLPPTCSR